MQPPSPSTVSLILGLVTVAAAFAGHYLSRRSKRDEIREQRVAQAFEERNTAFEQVSALADRYKGDADRERELRQKDNATWEARWDRQMNRCRKITETAANTISDLMKHSPANQQRDSSRVLHEISEHRQDDHPEP